MSKRSIVTKTGRIIAAIMFGLCVMPMVLSAARADECRGNQFQPTFVRHNSMQPQVYYVEPNGNFTLMRSPADAQATCRARGVRQAIAGGTCQQRNWGDFGCGCNITPSPNRTCARFQATVVAAFTRGAADRRFCSDLYARGDRENRAGNDARAAGNIAGARAAYQRALALFQQGAADRRCASLQPQFANAAAIVGRNIQRVAGGGGVRPPPPPASTSIVGTWRGCDGRTLTFSNVNGQYIGHYSAIGGLGRFGFKVGEISRRLQQQPDGRYVGDVKWRWANGRQEWRKTTITVNGNTLHDSAGDSCSRTMTRVR